MGLDCYMKHGNDHDKAFTHEDDERLKDIALCGGMFSGGGSDGSFRGKAYEPIMDELMNTDGCWHLSNEDGDDYVSALDLKEQAEQLKMLLDEIQRQFDGNTRPLQDDAIVYTTRHGWEYTWRELNYLHTLLHVCGVRGAVMTVWWQSFTFVILLSII